MAKSILTGILTNLNFHIATWIEINWFLILTIWILWTHYHYSNRMYGKTFSTIVYWNSIGAHMHNDSIRNDMVMRNHQTTHILHLLKENQQYEWMKWGKLAKLLLRIAVESSACKTNVHIMWLKLSIYRRIFCKTWRKHHIQMKCMWHRSRLKR